MKIVHLSDTHVGRDNNAARLQRVIDDILTLENPQSYVVVHTGDLIDREAPDQCQTALVLLMRLTDKGWKVLLCPGNHDYGDAMQVDPVRAQRFRDFFAPYIFAGENPSFPVVTQHGGCSFIGLDSSAAELGWWERWGAEGRLGQAQVAVLNAVLDRPDVQRSYKVLYLHHHPFMDAYTVRPDVGDGHTLRNWFTWATRRFRRLKDTYSLMQCIRDRVDLVLFGHKHFGQDYSFVAQSYGIAHALDASSTTATQMDTDRMRYRIVDTDTGQITVRLIPFP